MIDNLQWILLGGGAFIASTVAAVAGFGGSAILLPILVPLFGVREAIPILTVAQLIGNGSRVWFNRDEVSLPVVGWFALGGVPAAVAGGALFASAPLPFLTRLLGLFLLMIVIYRRVSPVQRWRIPIRGFTLIGALFSFISALLGTAGPLMAPFFLAYGLMKGAYIGTESLATVVMHITKLSVYGKASLLTPTAIGVGLGLGPIMILGSYIGKRVVDYLSERLFIGLVETCLVLAGLGLLIRG